MTLQLHKICALAPVGVTVLTGAVFVDGAPRMDEVLSLIADIYRAGTEPEHWGRVLARLADAMECSEATIGGQTAVKLPHFVSPRTDPDYIASYVEHYHVRNPMQFAMMSAPVGRAVIPAELVGRQVFESTGFYHEWCRPQKLHSGYAISLAADEGWRAVIMASGPQESRADKLALMGILAPHLQRAYELNEILMDRNSAELGLMVVLEEIGRGAIVVDGAGQVINCNGVAEAILRDGTGLTMIGRELGCALRPEADALLRLIAQCARGGIEGSGGRMSVTRNDRRRPLSVLCVPIPRRSPWPMARSAAAIVFVTDPDLLARRQGETLAVRFGLTPAEAALAWEIVKSGGRAAAADSRNVSVTTVRSQLSSIFDKTGVRRQTELVRLMLETLD